VIYRTEVFIRTGRIIFYTLVVGILFALFAISQVPALANSNVTVAWQLSADTSVVGYNVYFGGASQTYTNEFSVGDTTNAVISGLVPGTTYYFAITAYDDSGLESPFSNEASYAVPIVAPNNPPTLDAPGNFAINENAGSQTMNLTGISSGPPDGVQPLTVTAVSSNPALIPNPTVNYASANSTGTLTFTPASNVSGTSTITVTVNNGQTLNNTISRTFTVKVNAVNQAPTLNALGNLIINKNAGLQTVNLSGISSGAASENQTLTVTAVSSNPSLIPTPAVNYTSANSTGTLTFTPASNATGTSTITLSVNDGGKSNNIVTRTFAVQVTAVNQQPTLNALGNLTLNQNAGPQGVNLSGISSGAASENQTLTVTAVSSNPALISTPSISYSSPNTVGFLAFTPVSTANGAATISVSVNDGGTSNNIITRNFTVTINDPNQLGTSNQPPTLDALGGLAINENAGLQTVNLSGISSGAAGEVQTLTVTAVSSNPTLIPNPTVNYTSANSTGTLTFTPASNSTGSSTITVTINDGQTQSNTVTSTFTVTVNATNQLPTLNSFGNLSINENAGLQTINLGGISYGTADPSQSLIVSVVSSNPALIPTPTISYASPNTTGTFTFTPANNAIGTSTITVTVNDGPAPSSMVTRTFTITVNAVNLPPTLNPISNLYLTENAGAQVVNLSGITFGSPPTNKKQKIKIAASSSNSDLIKSVKAKYKSPNMTGELTFKPGKKAVGTATITVSVNNGAKANNLTVRTFIVTVLASPKSELAAKNIGSVVTIFPAATLTPAVHQPGEFALSLSGESGRQYVIQASENLIDWAPVMTNTAPFTFTDSTANQFKQRFYRSVTAQ
jgi:hypothetical protein